MSWSSIQSIVKDTIDKKTTAEENVLKSLELINKNTKYNAIISIDQEGALNRAKQIDELISKGKTPGKLAGVPFIAKDNFLTTNLNTTASSKMLKNFKAPYQATAINLLEKEGAIMVAKSNLDAFAHGSSTENSDFMTTSNPFDIERIAGGSSGGSASSVALDMAPFALGTDTGGSIRMPASICGVIGYKPTYGSVSRSGVVAMSSSLDTIGVFTKRAEDTALIMEVMTCRDPLDSTTIEIEDNNYSHYLEPKKIKIGLIKEHFNAQLDQDIKKGVIDKVSKLEKAGFVVEEVSIPDLPLALAVYYIVCPAEVASNLSRYDGIRFGHHTDNADNLSEYYFKSRSEGFGEEAKRRIMIGTHVLSSGYYEAFYNKAQSVRSRLVNQFQSVFKEYDFLIGPTTSDTAAKIGEKSNDPLSMYLMDIMTVAANLVGIPAISIPAGTKQGLPFGMQIMADQRNDHKLINLAKFMEAIE